MEINHRFLSACRREPVDATPVWFMRQAGRYMAEYRRLRERYSLLEICARPDLAAEVTLQPVEKSFTDADIGEISRRIVDAAGKLGARLRS